MNSRPGAAAVSLACLDTPATIALSEAVFTENLSALEAVDPALAARVAETPLPDTWRPVAGYDGAPTFVIESDTQRMWRHGTAIPHERARALLATYTPQHGNATLPGIGTGAELAILLKQLPRHVATFVFEESLVEAVAVLRTYPLAADLRARRCIILVGDTAEPSLRKLLDDYPGLLPPGNLVRLPGISDARIEAVRRLSAAAHEWTGAREAALQKLSLPEPNTAGTPRSIAVVCFSTDERMRAAADAMAHADAPSDVNVTASTLATPTDAHMLVHARRLKEAEPDTIVCAGLSPTGLPPAFQSRAIGWCTEMTQVKQFAKLPRCLAASPTLATRLTAAGAAKVDLLLFGGDARLPQTGSDPDGPIVLLGDLPNDSAAACGIRQPTHAKVWAALQAAARQRWDQPTIEHPQALLREAERATQLEIQDKALRGEMERLIELVVAPRAVWDQVVDVLAGAPLVSVGRGWEAIGARLTRHEPAIGKAQDLRPRAVVVGSVPDPLRLDLLDALVLEWPVAIHAAKPEKLAKQLAGVVQRDQHLATFAGAKDLRRLVSDAARGEQLRQMAARAGQHIRATATWPQRFAGLARD